VRFEVPASIRLNESQAFALSPDGRRLVFTGTGPDGILRIWSRTLDDLETRPLIGTENEVATNSTLWFSPDGRSIAFYAAGTIKRVEITGGVPQVICKVPSVAVGGSWSADGTIVVGNVGGGLLQCPATGGDPAPVTAKVSDDPTEIHLFPVFLPDNQRLIYLRVWRSNPARTGLYLADLRRTPDSQRDERLLATNFGAEFVTAPDGSGRVAFLREGALMATSFDVARGVVTGEPYEIAKGIGTYRDGANFRLSQATLAYRTTTQESQLGWLDRSGRRLATVGEPGEYAGLALSPDGSRVAVVRENRLNRADADIWIVDVQRSTTTRFTTDPLPESVPAWSADGASVIYVTGHDGGSIWQQPISGAARSALVSQLPDMPFRINTILTSLHATPDGRFVLFEAENRGGTRDDVWRVPISGNAAPSIVLGQPFNEGLAAISPDGRWIASVSNESGVSEVFVAKWVASTATAETGTLVSRGGATAPRWRRDSQELFYQSAAGRIIAVPIDGDRIGEPVPLFDAPGISEQWAVAADGQRFLFALPASQGAPTPFTVVLNWQSALK
jgi:serine/threonine-protein kinase